MKTKLFLFALLFTVCKMTVAAATVPTAPTIDSIDSKSQYLVYFTPGTSGGSAITTYEYSTDGGNTWLTRQTGMLNRPLSITTLSTNGTTPLSSGVSYNIKVRAVNAIGSGTPSASFSASYLYLGNGNGSALRPYKIYTAFELNLVRSNVNTAASTGADANAYYELANDIDLSAYSSWTGIGNSATNQFKGSFNGKGHTVTNVKLGTPSARTNTYYCGFFGNISDATISNLTVDIAFYISFSPTTNNTGPSGAGLINSVTGDVKSIVNNCNVTGVVDVLAIDPSLGVTSTLSRAGGIVCLVSVSGNLTIINSSVNGTITATNNPLFATTSGVAICGGIVGELRNTAQTVEVINCKASGSVSAISTGYNAYAGGILALYFAPSDHFAIFNCMANNAVLGQGGSNSNGATIAGGIVSSSVNALSEVTNCMALNSSIKATRGLNGGDPVLSRIGNKVLGTFTDNYAAANIAIQKTVAGIGPTIVTIASTDATSAQGASLGVNPTSEATTKLNAFVSSFVNYDVFVLNTWANTDVVTENEVLGVEELIKYSIVQGILTINGVKGSKLLSIYSVSGAIVKQMTVSESASIALSTGIYILKLDGAKPTKIVVY